MKNRLSQEFNTHTLIRFAMPTTVMLVFMSLYQMVDGVFVANLEGENALSALNIVYPVPSAIIAVSIMLATGGSAVIARNMGEKREREAKENFTLIIVAGLVVGAAFTVFGLLFLEEIVLALGATPSLYGYCCDYLRVLLAAALPAVFQMLFQTFFVTAGKPALGLVTTIIGGCVNVVFDYVFIKLCGMGVTGAAIATSMGYAVPALAGLLYFSFNRRGTLCFVRPVFRKGVLLHSCANGSSEMVNNIAVSITTFIFNKLMLKYAGEAGVAAITVVLYAQFFMTSAFMGFSGGVAPVISYNYGRRNDAQLRKIFRISMGAVTAASVLVFAFSELFSSVVIGVFASPGSEVFRLAKHGFAVFGVNFLFAGLNIYASGMFTAFSDGLVSAVISFLRTLVFLVASMLILPMLLDIDGVWLAVPAAEALAFIVSVYYLVSRRKKYHYAGKTD